MRLEADLSEDLQEQVQRIAGIHLSVIGQRWQGNVRHSLTPWA